MQHKITGDNMQALLISMVNGEEVYAEAVSMLYYRGGIHMDSKARGGIMKSIGRALFTGESILMTTFECTGESGEVAFAAPIPGKIIDIELTGNELLCNKDAFLCSTGAVDVSIAFTKKFGAGLFGGQGFILEKLSGTGTAFLHSGGNFVEINLVEGETMMVDTGCIVMMEPSVDYDIKFVGGIKKAVFGGEGLFLASLTGPGKVILQTLPFARLAQELAGLYSSGAGGNAASVIGNVLGG